MHSRLEINAPADEVDSSGVAAFGEFVEGCCSLCGMREHSGNCRHLAAAVALPVAVTDEAILPLSAMHAGNRGVGHVYAYHLGTDRCRRSEPLSVHPG